MKKLFHRFLVVFDRMPLGRQLYGAFALAFMLTAAVGAVAFNAMNRIDAQGLATKWLQGVAQIGNLRSALLETRELEVKHSRSTERSYQTEYEEKIAVASKMAAAALAAYQKLPGDAAENALLAKVVKGSEAYAKAQQKVIALGRGKQQQDAADISDGLASTAFDETIGAIDQLTRFNFAGSAAAGNEAAVLSARAKQQQVGLLLAALVLGVALARALTNRLLRQLGGEPRAAAEVAAAVAGGTLTTPIALRPGDTTSLMAQLAAMQSGLAGTVGGVRRGSENVAAASAQIAQDNRELSDRTEQQAGSLQETAATMSELGATVATNAESARQANQLALGASSVALRGGEVVGQVVETMKGINASSQRIAEIVGTIDGIAFQTNILALNAAVEAARAGEQGRGFAVVASEVRLLAQRSAAAAKEIKGLIQASVERVGHGTALVDRAGQTMGEIVSAIQRVTDIVGEISAASAAQSSGVTQVGAAVSQMDQATQQNATLVERSAAAASGLQQQAQELVRAVAVFTIDAGATAAPVPTPTPTPPAPAPAPVGSVRALSPAAAAANPAALARSPARSAARLVATAPTSTATAVPALPPGVINERRSPNRAKNVARLKRPQSPTAPVIASEAAGADWESF
jgi:methyl-accepting chemotaxis protein